MTTSDIIIVGTAKDVVTVADPQIDYRPAEIQGDRYIVDLQEPQSPKRDR